MKVAIASKDGITISQHFGESACFIIYEVFNGMPRLLEVRELLIHASGASCGEVAHAHGHEDLYAALENCDLLLCGGIGSRAAEDLKSRQIPVLVTLDHDLTPEQAMNALICGSLRTGTAHRCCREHKH